ncbi:hypothetical protein SSX86_024286 [Deinandra increscens subsp. villosa]|uniref:DUF8039 domain-containing protein n=1 Tax=Deinandra increscens subsp. villosa TaxID=3103831 RepID=A0AAP0CHQ0_9ASTR
MSRKRGERGVACCSEKHGEDEYYIEFDKNMRPVGVKASQFMSWIGVKCRSDLPYHIDTNKIEQETWDDFWLETKVFWNIPNDKPKTLVLKRAKRICTNWKSYLVTKFVKVGKTPFSKYTYLEDEHWAEFVAAKTSEAFLVKSEKAKKSADANKNFSRCGRTGSTGLDPKVESRWQQLRASYPYLESIKDTRSIKWTVARAKKNLQTNLYEIEQNLHAVINNLAIEERKMIEDGSYYEEREDPITRVLGPEHGGRSRTVSTVIGVTQVQGGLFKRNRQQNQENVLTKQARIDAGVDASQGFHASSGSCIDNPSIESICRCDLLFPHDPSDKLKIGRGLVYPTSVRILHGCQMNDGFVKVQVDTIEISYEKLPVHPMTRTDEIKCIGDTRNQFVQWPRNAIEVVGPKFPTKSRSTSSKASSHSLSRPFHTLQQIDTELCYRPQLDELDEHEQQSQYELHTGDHLQMDADFLENLTNLMDIPQVSVPQPHVSRAPVPKTKSHEKIRKALKKIESMRPQVIQNMAERLTKHFGDNISMEISSPLGMYPEVCMDYIEYEGMLQLLANGLVDISIVHWCEMYLYELSNRRQIASRCAFFNTVYITGTECRKRFANVQKHILSVYEKHSEIPYFLAPCFNSAHWSLLIISPTHKEGYILDSIRGMKNHYDYPLIHVIEKSFGGNFEWQMVKINVCDFKIEGVEDRLFCKFVTHGISWSSTFRFEHPVGVYWLARNATEKLKPLQVYSMMLVMGHSAICLTESFFLGLFTAPNGNS